MNQASLSSNSVNSMPSDFVALNRNGVQAANSEALAPPLVITTGEIRQNIQLPADKQTVHYDELSFSLLEKLRQQTSHYQPIMFLLDSRRVFDRLVDLILENFDSHLLIKIVLVDSGQENDDQKQRCLLMPLRNPCHPVSVVFLPKGQSKLDWEVANFFIQTETLSKHCKQMLRFVSLSDRENRVSNYISIGLPNKKISSLISVSEKTIEKCRSDIYSKLGVTSGPELASLMTFKNFFRWPGNVAFPIK